MKFPFLLILFLTSIALGAVSMDSNGWTSIEPSADSRIIYVSSSQGNDSNDGLSPSSPKQTISAGNSLIRDGFPDHLLLKRGDVFPAESTNILGRWKNGRNAQEPIVLSFYGSMGDRPIVKVTDKLIDHAGQARNYQSIIGIDIYKAISDHNSPEFTNTESSTALRFVGGGSHLLIEDCRMRFIMTTIQSHDGNSYSNLTFRRNIVTDTWAHGSSEGHAGRIQGMYLQGIKQSCLFEENVFDHCGWNESISGAGANMYNHNVYILQNSDAGAIIRGNVFARGAAHGLQARSGGLIDRNLFVLNSIAVNVGYHVTAPTDPNVYTFPNRAKENVILNGRRQNPNSSSPPVSTAVWGIWCHANLPDVLVEDNIVANRSESGNNISYVEVETAEMINNISYKWGGVTETIDPNWPHPDDDLGDYYLSIGGTDDTLAYLEWLRNRPIRSLPWEMTAYSAINHIRSGFNKPSITGYYDYEAYQEIPVTGIFVNETTLSLSENRSQQLTVLFQPDNATNRNVSWTSDNEAIATISVDGFLTTISQGNAKLTATSDDGGFTASINLIVTESFDSGNLLSGGDFESNPIRDMPNPYVVGIHDTQSWFARHGTCGQCSQIKTEDNNPFLDAGHGTTNGTFQVIEWPGEGNIQLNFIHRELTRVRISGANTGDEIGKYDNANSMTELEFLETSESTAWTEGSITANLDSEFDFIVIQFINGELDNVTANFNPLNNTVTTWAGFPVVDGWVDSDKNIKGWIYIDLAPWIFSDSLLSWFLAPNYEAWETTGQWVYPIR